MPARALLIGLDGATFDLIEPWAAAGLLPTLARLMGQGAWGRLRSTVPPATFPAWTSLVTGVGPGGHGLYDFTRRIPGTYRLEFVNATYRRRPSVWRLLSEAGQRVAAIGFPASYPPEPVNGVLIGGFDSPVATAIDRSFVYPPGLYDDIRRAAGPYPLTGFQELRVGPGWHDLALTKLLHAIDRRTEIAAYLLRREVWDCFAIHFGESDTVAHHFWAFHDPDSPRYDAAGAARWGQAIRAVYEALDRAVGLLLECTGEEYTVLIASDHGSGGTGERVIHLNRWLAAPDQGWLRFAPRRGREGDQEEGEHRGSPLLKRVGLALPTRLQEWAFRGSLRPLAGRLESGARFGGLDWTHTAAFSEEVNTFPAIWLNVRGREPQGIVEPGAGYERLRDEIITRLLGWRDPDTGAPVIARAWPREELYHGPAVGDAPDIVIEPALDRGYAATFLPSRGRPGEAIRRLAPSERLGAKGGSMNGSHRPDGVAILAGPGVPAGGHGRLHEAHIVDVAPTLLHLLGLPQPSYFDGRVWVEALDGERAGEQARGGPVRPPIGVMAPAMAEAGQEGPQISPYSDREAAIVDKRLQGLGYRP